MVAREFRDGDCSHIDTFSPTTPLPIVKLLIILSMLYDLAICSLDVGDAFLQVPQRTTVLIEVPLWAQQEQGEKHQFWILRRCLPGQHAAASEWNQFFVEVCARHGFDNFQGTIFKHREQQAYISAHIDDLLVVGSKEFILGFHDELSKELKLKIEGPLQCGDEGSIYYLKRELQFTEHGIYVAPSSRYIPRLLEILKIKDRSGRTVPHHGCLEIFDAASIADDEFLNGDDARVSICTGDMYLLESRTLRHTTPSSSSCHIHGTPHKNGNECGEEAWKLFDVDKRDETLLWQS